MRSRIARATQRAEEELQMYSEGLSITVEASCLRDCLFLACTPFEAIFDIVLTLVKVLGSSKNKTTFLNNFSWYYTTKT